MILYTIVPLEQILDEEEDAAGHPAEMAAGKGVRLLVEPAGPGRARIVRVISTSPAPYLDPALQPGSLIAWANATQAPMGG